MEQERCCPFLSTPGRFAGEWTNCIHGLIGKRNELLRNLSEVEDQIWKKEVERAAKLIGQSGVCMDSNCKVCLQDDPTTWRHS